MPPSESKLFQQEDMNRDELIELVAAVSLRISAFIYVIAAFRNVYHLLNYMNHDRKFGTLIAITDSSIGNDYLMDIAFDGILALVIFLLTVPLSRLLCRGLSHALEQKPSE